MSVLSSCDKKKSRMLVGKVKTQMETVESRQQNESIVSTVEEQRLLMKTSKRGRRIVENEERKKRCIEKTLRTILLSGTCDFTTRGIIRVARQHYTLEDRHAHVTTQDLVQYRREHGGELFSPALLPSSHMDENMVV